MSIEVPNMPQMTIREFDKSFIYPHIPTLLSQVEDTRKYSSPKQTVLSLLKSHGTDTLSYFSLQKNRKYFFSTSQRSFFSYCIKGNIAVIGADPTGVQEEMPELINSFLSYLRSINKRPCFLGVSKTYAQYLKSKKFRVFKIGEEAIIDLVTFNEELLKKKVRRVTRHMHRLDVHIEIYNRQCISHSLFNQIRQTSKIWFSSRKKQERGFSMTLGTIPTKFHKDCEFIIALKGKKILGYLCFVPVYKGNAWSLDSMRRRENTPNGLMEFLMIQAAKHYQTQGYKRLSLNFATFANTKNDITSKFFSHILSIVYRHLSKFYQCKSLHQFNKKFSPEWESRYLAVTSLRSLPFSAVAIIKAEKLF